MNPEMLLLVIQQSSQIIPGDNITFSLPIVGIFVTNAVVITGVYIALREKLTHIVKTLDNWEAAKASPPLLEARLSIIEKSAEELTTYAHNVGNRTHDYNNWFGQIANKLDIILKTQSR